MSSRPYSDFEMTVGGVSIGLLIIFAVAFVWSKWPEKTQTPEDTAANMCIDYIKKQYGPDKSVSLPYPHVLADSVEFILSWYQGAGFQVDGVPKKATCVVGRNPLAITLLTIDGLEMTWTPPKN